jgi:hypothetical protein
LKWLFKFYIRAYQAIEMATESIQAKNEDTKAIKLCKSEDCSPTEDDEHTEKCMLCDGYFADDGLNDCYNLDDNDEGGWCSLCNKHSDQVNLVKMKDTGEVICTGACDESEDESDAEESEDSEESDDE